MRRELGPDAGAWSAKLKWGAYCDLSTRSTIAFINCERVVVEKAVPDWAGVPSEAMAAEPREQSKPAEPGPAVHRQAPGHSIPEPERRTREGDRADTKTARQFLSRCEPHRRLGPTCHKLYFGS